MGRGSFKGGNVFAQNLQGGKVTATLGGTGTDIVRIVYPHKMKNMPAVIASVQSNKAVSVVVSSSTSVIGANLKATSTSLTGECIFGWVAYDDSFK